jgi:hypothetical protein
MWNGEMLDARIGLLQRKNRKISARIPHQSAARTSLADSFSPGEAICAAVRRCRPARGDTVATLNNNLSIHSLYKFSLHILYLLFLLGMIQ